MIHLPGTGARMQAISIPRPIEDLATSALLKPEEDDWEPYIAELLGFTYSMFVRPEDPLDAMLATRPDRSETYRGRLTDSSPSLGSVLPEDFTLDYLEWVREEVDRLDPRLHRFVARVALEPLIPVEHSAAESSPLVELIQGAGSSVGLGYLSYAAHEPLLLVTIPAAIVILGVQMESRKASAEGCPTESSA